MHERRASPYNGGHAGHVQASSTGVGEARGTRSPFAGGPDACAASVGALACRFAARSCSRRCFRAQRGPAKDGIVIDLRSIKVFLAVADAGGFTLAAKRLEKTQSAVSQAIRQLEEELGVVLINRAARPMSLTPSGQTLRDRGYQLLEEANSLTASIREGADSKTPEIRMAFVDSFAMLGGPRLLKGLLDHAQNLALSSGLTPSLGHALARRELDIIVGNDSFDDVDGLVRFELMREPYVLLVPNLPAYRPDVGLEQLARNFPMIRYDARSFMATQIDRQLHRMNVRSTRRIRVDSTDKLIAMVAGGLGWTSTTPLSLLRARELLPEVTVRPFPGPPFFRHLFMICHQEGLQGLTRSLAVQARALLKEQAIGELSALFPWLRGQLVIADANGQ